MFLNWIILSVIKIVVKLIFAIVWSASQTVRDMLSRNGKHRDYQRDEKWQSQLLQRSRLLLYTDAGDVIFLLADLQRRGFHDEGH